MAGESTGLTTVQTAGLWGTAIQAVGSIFTSYQASRSATELSRIQQRIAEINQQRATIQAQAALAASNRNIANITGQYGRLKSKQRVAMAANGIAIGYGSSKEILATTDLYKQQDANTAYANGLNAAMGYMSKATAQYQASIAAGGNKSNSGLVAADSLLTGITKVAGYYVDQASRNAPAEDTGGSTNAAASDEYPPTWV